MIILACAAHDTHNALRWSMAEFYDKGLLRSVWISQASCRNSFNMCVGYLAQFLLRHMELVPEWTDAEKEMLRSLWGCLKLPDRRIHYLVDVFQIRVVDGRLLVNNRAAECCDVAHGVYTTLMDVWKFRAWADSRWLTSRKVAKRSCASKITGLSIFVRWIETLDVGLGHSRWAFSDPASGVDIPCKVRHCQQSPRCNPQDFDKRRACCCQGCRYLSSRVFIA